MSFPNAIAVSFGEARDPFYDTTITLQPIITPITTHDEILGQDKKKVFFTVGPKNLSAACLKDGMNLSKFWGDEDNDATDSTLDPETDSEAHNNSHSPDASKHLVSPHETVKSKKADIRSNTLVVISYKRVPKTV